MNFSIGSFFSGIGGLELGLERAGLGPTKWQVENNPSARRVLAHHWPKAKLYEDVRTVTGAGLEPVDIICGGFPCQDVSSAGSRLGLSGSRSGLWFEFERIVGETKPSWVVVENVASGAKAWVDIAIGGLERQGYACLPIPLAASDVGAPHQRKRVFIVAHLDRDTKPLVSFNAEVGQTSQFGSNVANANGKGLSKGRVPGRPRPQVSVPSNGGWGGHWQSVEPGLVPLVHGISSRLAGRVRREQIRLLGNAVVPQCSEVIGWIIRELAGDVP